MFSPEIAHIPDKLWSAARAKPRCEKVLARYCETHNICYYLPLRRRAKRYQRRTVESYIPMFTGYVFVQLDSEEKQKLAESSKLVHILCNDIYGEERLISELRDVQRLEELSRQEDIIVQPEVLPGKPVRIISGPLQGTMGVVETRGSKLRVTVNVELLGQSVSTELDIGELQIDEAD